MPKCTADNPYTPEREQSEPGFWEHDAAHEVGEQENGWPGGDIVRIRCDDCGVEWKSELPQ